MPWAYYHNCTDVKLNTSPTFHWSNKIRVWCTVVLIACWHPLSAQMLFCLRQRVGCEKLVALETAIAKLPHNSAAIYKPWIKSWTHREREEMERERGGSLAYLPRVHKSDHIKEVLQKIKEKTAAQTILWTFSQPYMYRPLALGKTLSPFCTSNTYSVLHIQNVLMQCTFFRPF